eukprot:CAMPEP_0113457954 /NCGR_PEP_ID=MMETSP0014_2-20120614/9672_1 /TAXON_ID=2857 /ORGANISM="Nitzschia sp." /LENGTH=298 /DNA_ID=CAMNT_0000349461 /DNA_START=71 /DNA_END=967 /DNA_ORIENTATION=- /assembly_acc=CAM_ASM_000159
MTASNQLMLTAFVPSNNGLVRDGRDSRINVDRNGRTSSNGRNTRMMKRGSKECRQIWNFVRTGSQTSSSSPSSLSYSLSSCDPFVVQDNVASISSSSTSLYIGATEIAPPPTTVTTYDAVMPSKETLVGMGFIVVLCAVAAWVWSEQVVPVSRTKLALSKKDGEVKAYLDELKASSSSSSTSTSDSNNTVQQSEATLVKTNTVVEENDTSRPTPTPTPTTKKVANDRAFERWLFNDWLENNKSAAGRGGRKKEPALPILKSAKWNSGDNPVVVAAALMIIGLVLTAVVEQGSALLQSS